MSRSWLATFADEAVLSDLRAAARACMAELDDCEPEECPHPEQRMSPAEFAQWVERAVHIEQQRPQKFERGHRPRRMKDGSMSLAIAG